MTITSTSDWRAMRSSIKSIATSGALAALIATATNVVIWFVANALGGSVLPVAAVIINSVLGVVMGGLIYLLLSRFMKRANLIFTIISIVFLVLYAFMPVNALSTPPTGIEPFNVTTVIATEIMHIVAGTLAIWAYTKRTHT